MKKLKVLFLSVLALTTIVSCNKDDDDKPAPSIEGTWQLSKEGETVKTLTAAENEGNCGTTTVAFNSDKTFTVTDYYFSDKCNQFSENGKWEKTDKGVKVTLDGETAETTIVELTESTLTIDQSDEEGTWFEQYTRK